MVCTSSSTRRRSRRRACCPISRPTGRSRIAFGRPIDDRACQVKGVVIDTRAATEAERPVVAAQWDGFLGSLEQIGIPRAATEDLGDVAGVAIRVRVNALFNQTPGPGAGAPIA